MRKKRHEPEVIEIVLPAPLTTLCVGVKRAGNRLSLAADDGPFSDVRPAIGLRYYLRPDAGGETWEVGRFANFQIRKITDCSKAA